MKRKKFLTEKEGMIELEQCARECIKAGKCYVWLQLIIDNLDDIRENNKSK